MLLEEIGLLAGVFVDAVELEVWKAYGLVRSLRVEFSNGTRTLAAGGGGRREARCQPSN